MSLSKRHNIEASKLRVRISLDALPHQFVARNPQQALRVLNALDAARDSVNRAHREINRELNR